ncbi:hypothetical protein [Bacillus sp. SD088]|uniref:hypothetical protein n=1 Tax=Bacillus sp. SD088 TaxID=2782012 RepID=UPI001A9738B9|nr:hypothetical protein [Bacillus sp. SD088]MBO0995033.1 hypothetical protein [Bacillus sp. SD088]
MRNMSLEELLTLREELQVSVDEEKSVSLSALIGVEEELLQRLARQKKDENPYDAKEVQRALIAHLLLFGAYTKTYYKRDLVDDQKSLTKVLKYDRGNTAAYYRLGMHAYRKNFFITAAVHFNNALKSHEQAVDSPFSLSKQQQYQVLLYLQNSTLKVATETEAMTRKVEENMDRAFLAHSELPPLQENIRQQEVYLQNHAFTVLSEHGLKGASKEECEKLMVAAEEKPTLVLYFSDDQQSVIFQRKEVSLTIQQAIMLKRFLLNRLEGKPVERAELTDVFASRGHGGKVPAAVYRQALTRLKKQLAKLEIGQILSEQENGDLFQADMPFLCIQRAEQF